MVTTSITNKNLESHYGQMPHYHESYTLNTAWSTKFSSFVLHKPTLQLNERSLHTYNTPVQGKH